MMQILIQSKKIKNECLYTRGLRPIKKKQKED